MAIEHPFRFGISLLGFDHGHDWPEISKKIEDLGFSTLLVPDHFGDQLAPFPALMAAAANTTTLRVGTYMCAVDFRHPAMLAKEAATVDLLSCGRFELGIGAGWYKSEYDQTGLEFSSGSDRRARLKEAVSIIKGMWSGEPFSFKGEHYAIDDMVGRPLPFDGVHPPVLIGGAGPLMLSLAAQVANIISIAPRTLPAGIRDDSDITEASIATKLAIISEAAGARHDQIELNALVLAVRITNDQTSATNELSQRYGITPAEVLASPHLLVGSVNQVVDALIERRERFGLSYVTVAEPALNDMAPIVDRLARS